MTAPCDDSFVGRPLGDWCNDCGHVLGVHRRDHVCSVCELIDELRVVPEEPQPEAK